MPVDFLSLNLGRHLPATALFVGGSRSGKSSLALNWAENFGAEKIFIATASMAQSEQYNDCAMLDRIKRHKKERDASWQTIESPIQLLKSLQKASLTQKPVVIDCITLWLSNLMAENMPYDEIIVEVKTLAIWLATAKLPIALVSNEIGLGLVPNNPLGREFRDIAGESNQILAKACKTVFFVTCGLPLVLKGKQ